MKQIKNLDTWSTVLEQSKHQPLLLFKFSTTCASSVSAFKEIKALQTELPTYIVIIQPYRDVSNAIATDLGVRHESPQLLILKEGRAIWQATHYKIKGKTIQKAIRDYV